MHIYIYRYMININELVNLIKMKTDNKNLFLFNFIESILRIIDIEINIEIKSNIFDAVNIFRQKLANDLIDGEYYKKLNYNLKIDRNKFIQFST